MDARRKNVLDSYVVDIVRVASPNLTLKRFPFLSDLTTLPLVSSLWTNHHRYIILGFISSGTYGKVYKARLRSPMPHFNPTQPTRPGDLVGREGDLYAIKKFKPDKEGEVVTYTGISQSAIREIAVRPRIRESIASTRKIKNVKS